MAPKNQEASVQEQPPQTTPGAELAQLREDYQNLQRTLESERSTHKTEVTRLEEALLALQKVTNSVRNLTPEHMALLKILGHLEGVAVGGAVSSLRATAASALIGLAPEQKQNVREYVQRMRLATEAVEQEIAAASAHQG